MSNDTNPKSLVSWLAALFAGYIANAEGNQAKKFGRQLLLAFPDFEQRRERAAQQVLQNLRSRPLKFFHAGIPVKMDQPGQTVTFYGEPDSDGTFWCKARFHEDAASCALGLNADRIRFERGDTTNVAQFIWNGVSDEDRLALILQHFLDYMYREENRGLQSWQATTMRTLYARLASGAAQVFISPGGMLKIQ